MSKLANRKVLLKTIKGILLFDQERYFKKVVKVSRKLRMIKDKTSRSPLDLAAQFYLTRKRNKLSPKRNVWLQGRIGNNIKIWHANVIINQFAEIGDNCIFHGNNCVGNNGKDIEACPKIGDNVDIGYGASIYGDICIADNVIIGAGAVVVESVLEKGVVVAGVPAKVIKTRDAS